jgi:hypothetical protein
MAAAIPRWASHMCRRRPQDLPLCQWLHAHGTTASLGISLDSQGYFIASDAVRRVGTPLLDVPMHIAIAIEDDIVRREMGKSAVDAMWDEMSVLTKALLVNDANDTSPFHVFAKALIDRVIEETDALEDGDEEFVDEEDAEDDVASDKPPHRGKHRQVTMNAAWDHVPFVTRTAETARLVLSAQQCITIARQTTSYELIPRVQPAFAAVLRSAIVEPPLPFELVPLLDRFHHSETPNATLTCIADSVNTEGDSMPLYRISTLRPVKRGDAVTMNLHAPVMDDDQLASDLAVLGRGWRSSSREAQLAARFGLCA